MEYEKLIIPLILLIAGWYVVDFLTHGRWWKEYRLRKLEELYLAVNEDLVVKHEYYLRLTELYGLPSEDPNRKEQEQHIRTVYLRAHQEGEKNATIPMVIAFYFEPLMEIWKEIERAEFSVKDKITDLHLHQGNLPDEREKLQAAHVFKLDFSLKLWPEVELLKAKMLRTIVRIGEQVKSEKPWPFNLFQRKAQKRSG